MRSLLVLFGFLTVCVSSHEAFANAFDSSLRECVGEGIFFSYFVTNPMITRKNEPIEVIITSRGWSAAREATKLTAIYDKNTKFLTFEPGSLLDGNNNQFQVGKVTISYNEYTRDLGKGFVETKNLNQKTNRNISDNTFFFCKWLKGI